jgi:hypothetical protein
MTIELKQNIAGYYDEMGRFRPIRSPQYVGSGGSRRKATKSDKRKYSKAKGGDLGKLRQERALEAPWDREYRLQQEEIAARDRERKRIEREIERDIAGDEGGRMSTGKARTLAQFVRGMGGINTQTRVKRGRVKYGDLENFTLKGSGSRGLVTTTPGKGLSLDYMHQAAREAGYDVTDMDDLLDRLDDEIRGNSPTYSTKGSMTYNPLPKYEYVYYATKIGDPDWKEIIAISGRPEKLTPDQLAKVKAAMKKDGYDRLRMAKIDLSTAPNFGGTVRRNPAKRNGFTKSIEGAKNVWRHGYTVDEAENSGHKLRELTLAARQLIAEGHQFQKRQVTSLKMLGFSNYQYIGQPTAKRNPAAKKNPDAISLFASLAGGVASALSIKQHLDQPAKKAAAKKRGTTRAKTTMRRSNPSDGRQIAATIREQLGGRKFEAMTGAKDFMFGPKYLQFRLPANVARSGINIVKISLTPADLYDVEYMKYSRLNFKTIAVSEGLMAGDLRSDFTAKTGLDTSLGTAGRRNPAAIGKRYNEMFNVGKVKYLVNFHDGKKTHSDGSPFFDIRTFSSKKLKDTFVKSLIAKGYSRGNPAAAAKRSKAPKGDLYVLTIGSGDDLISVYLHDGDKDGFSKRFKTLAAAKAFATRNKVKLVDNPAAKKVNGVISRAWARSRAKAEYARELRLAAAADRARSRRQKAEAKAKANPLGVKWVKEYCERQLGRPLNLRSKEDMDFYKHQLALIRRLGTRSPREIHESNRAFKKSPGLRGKTSKNNPKSAKANPRYRMRKNRDGLFEIVRSDGKLLARKTDGAFINQQTREQAESKIAKLLADADFRKGFAFIGKGGQAAYKAKRYAKANPKQKFKVGDRVFRPMTGEVYRVIAIFNDSLTPGKTRWGYELKGEKDGVQGFSLGGDITKFGMKTNPNSVPRRRTFEMFQGRPATTAKAMPVSRLAPAKMDQLGDLVEIKLNSGKVLNFANKKFKLCAAGGKLWIAGGKLAKANPSAKANAIDAIDAIDHVVYGTRKPHHGDHKYTHYIHRLGEESGLMPTLCVDREGFPIIRGGNYKIEARGIVD